MKYRYVITNEGVIDWADSDDDAKALAYEMLEDGAGIFTCEVEPIIREVTRDE